MGQEAGMPHQSIHGVPHFPLLTFHIAFFSDQNKLEHHGLEREVYELRAEEEVKMEIEERQSLQYEKRQE